MKTAEALLILLALLTAIAACTNTPERPVSVQAAEVPQAAAALDEVKGKRLEAAVEKIEPMLTLDRNAVITDARLLFLKQVDGHWIPRQSGNAKVEVDFSVTPAAAVPGQAYKAGKSMFRVETVERIGRGRRAGGGPHHPLPVRDEAAGRLRPHDPRQ